MVSFDAEFILGTPDARVQGASHALRVHLCEDEVVFVTIDSRTGRLNMRDTGDLAAAGRAPRFVAISDKVNEQPTKMLEALIRLRFTVRTLFEFSIGPLY